MIDRLPYLFDKAALAEYLCISPDTVEARAKNGMLPPGKLWGGKMMWRRADVEAHIDATLGMQPTEAALADRVRHATKKAVNAR